MAIRPIFDTNAVIEYRNQIDEIIHLSFMASIVFFELLSTSIDKSELQTYTRWRHALNRHNQILSPTENDFWETGKVLNRLYLKKTAPTTKLNSIRQDAIIARLAVRHKHYIVTNDVDDFELIKREMKDLRIISANEFFGI